MNLTTTTNNANTITPLIKIEDPDTDHTTSPSSSIIMTDQTPEQPQPDSVVHPTQIATNTEHSCTELKNIKYKMRLMNPSTNTTEIKTNNNSYDKLQMFLDDEKNKNKLENWNKLNKSIKNKKIEEYVNKYIIENNYETSDKESICIYLHSRINQGKLSKNKEVIYDKTSGIVKDIPGFIYNKNTKHVTIKNVDTKYVSTLKNLKTSFKSNTAL
jgi:hypothetical protein